jgi:glycosyltransferase involved in cell wall biosynthesis
MIAPKTPFPTRAEGAPRVSVVMPVFNAGHFLEEAITSVLVQTYSDFELIVVDDASSDDSLALVENFRDPRIRIIKHATNKGAALSRNDALAVARGEFVAIMDADDVCAANRFERQVMFLDTHPEVGVVGCAIYDNIDDRGTVLHRATLPEDNETIQRTLMQRWCFLHSSLMFRKALSEISGEYRQIFEPAEDHDFVLRLLEYSRAHNLGESLVQYRLNPHGLTVSGRDYLDEVSRTAIRLAEARRQGQPEDLEAQIPRLLKLKQIRTSKRWVATIAHRWRDSQSAAIRYYEFGCHELQAGDSQKAYQCFVRSVQTNKLSLKSWLGLMVYLMKTLSSGLSLVRGDRD